MELFDIVKSIFKNDKEWGKVSRNDKVKNFFMINRIMSIEFPIQANQFNHTKISPRPVVDWWHGTLSKHYTRSPQWIFTKTKKNEAKEKKTDDFQIDEDTEKFIMNKFELSRRELSELKKFYPEKYKEWTKSIQDQLKSISK